MTITPNVTPSSSNATPHRKKSSKNNKHPHLMVQHNYHDHAQDPIFDCSDQEKQNLGGVATPFPIRLYEMLSTLGNHCDVVSWQPHGRCFVVHKPDEFTRLLPQFFKLSKIASFQRQLNLYGFVRLTAGRDKSGYYHERFLRGRKDLLWTIPRAKVKGTKVRAKSNPADEPDLWSMEWVGVPSDDKKLKQKYQQQPAPPATTLKAALAVVPDQTSSLSSNHFVYHQQQQLHRSQAARNQSLSVVSASGDDFDHVSQSSEEPEDFFDRLLDEMFDSDQAFDFDSLQRQLVPEY